ncbi:MAG: DUF7429 family protein [Mycobacterium sp.]
MRVSLALNIFDVHVARLDVQLDEDAESETQDAMKAAAGQRVVKWLSRVWVKGMTA